MGFVQFLFLFRVRVNITIDSIVFCVYSSTNNTTAIDCFTSGGNQVSFAGIWKAT
jgi:hypothetical protein